MSPLTGKTTIEYLLKSFSADATFGGMYLHVNTYLGVCPQVSSFPTWSQVSPCSWTSSHWPQPTDWYIVVYLTIFLRHYPSVGGPEWSCSAVSIHPELVSLCCTYSEPHLPVLADKENSPLGVMCRWWQWWGSGRSQDHHETFHLSCLHLKECWAQSEQYSCVWWQNIAALPFHLPPSRPTIMGLYKQFRPKIC